MSRRGQKRNRGHGQNVRTDRIGATLREVIAEELMRIDDDVVAYVTVTEVDVDNELTKARVYLSSLDLDETDIDGVRAHAGRIKRAIGKRTRIKRVPDLEFLVDPGLISGTRVDDILRSMDDDRAFSEADAAGEATTASEEE